MERILPLNVSHGSDPSDLAILGHILLLVRCCEARVDIDVTSGGAGMYSDGGPFGHGALDLDVSTAEVAGMDVSIDGA